MKKRLDKGENPDIELTADVKAKELRFDEVPDTEVHPPAHTERENLPEEVRAADAGTTFRNVSVRLRIASELTVNGSGRWKESKEVENERFMRKQHSGKPSTAAKQSKEETGKETE